MRSKQGGLSLIGLIIGLAILGAAGLVVAKSTPAWVEYWNIRKIISTMASQGDLTPSATKETVRASFDRRATIDDVTSIAGKDLTFEKDSAGVTVKFAYQRVVPIAGNTSLLFDFDGTQGATRREALVQ